MKSIRLLVRDAARSIQGTVAPPWAGAIVGALAADPETVAELDEALQRFQVDAPLIAWRESFVDCDEDLDDHLWGAIIDLPARLIFWSGGPGPDPGRSAAPVLDHGEPLEVELPYQLSGNWQIIHGWDEWREHVEDARRAQAEHPPTDVRQVLYDRLCEALAEALYQARIAGQDVPVTQIHAAWLSTPRADLDGRTPRDVLVADQDTIERELDWRRAEWSRLGRPPTAVPRESRAFREAGIGLHEFILYYDLVRHLLERACDQAPAVITGVESLADWLRGEQQAWLHRRIDDGQPDAFMPSEVIDLERQRMPLTASAESSMIDCDCPLCQMMAEENLGPTFVHFDTTHFELDFVFSPYQDRADWELDYGMWRGPDDLDSVDDAAPESPTNVVTGMAAGPPAEPGSAAPRGPLAGRMRPPALSTRGDEQDDDLLSDIDYRVMPLSTSRASELIGNLGRLSGAAAVASAPRANQLWSRSFIAPTPPSASRETRLQSCLFEVAAHAAELRDNLRTAPQQFQRMERVLEEFTNMRAAMREQDFSRVHRLTERCVDELNAVGVARQEMAEQAADLEASFRRLERTICEKANERPDKPADRKPQRRSSR